MVSLRRGLAWPHNEKVGGDPRMGNDRSALEDVVAYLPGQRLEAVRYYELRSSTGGDSWDRACAHRLDYGVDLVTERGCYGVIWANDIVTHNLTVVGHSLIDEDLLAACFQRVDDRPPWAGVIGTPITQATVHYHDLRYGDEEPIDFPFALRLRFAAETTVLMVAGCWTGPRDPILPRGDEIVVLWQPDTFSRLVPDIADQLRG
jgi:hypothetical protein